MRRIFEFIALLAIAASMRAPITSVPPQVASIREAFGISLSTFGLLTTIPLVCFALAAPLPTSRLLRRLPPETLVLGALLTLSVGIVTRSWPSLPTVFGSTVAIGVGIAVLNVLTPVIIRRDYPDRVTRIMPFYTATMAITASAGAGLSIPISNMTTGDWRGGTTIWAVVSTLTFALWLPALPHFQHRNARWRSGTGVSTLRNRQDVAVSDADHGWSDLLRNRTAWHVAAYMGTQSCAFYGGVAWLPRLLQEHGASPSTAGALLAYTTGAGFLFTLLVPLSLGRGHDQRRAVVTTAVAPLIGFTGLALLPGAPPLIWLTLLGIGHAALPVAFVLMTMRAPSASRVGQLSAMAQGFGYLMACTIPTVLGAVREATHAWAIPTGLLACLSAQQLYSGLRAARPESTSAA